jgi:hypothetical protein
MYGDRVREEEGKTQEEVEVMNVEKLPSGSAARWAWRSSRPPTSCDAEYHAPHAQLSLKL